MGPRRTIVLLCAATCLLAAAASSLGLLAPGADPVAFTTARGQTALLHGAGIYRFESVFVAAGFRGQDAVMLLLAVPLLAAATLRLSRRGAPRDLLLVIPVLAYVLYVYATMALNAAFNALFLVYVGAFSASFFALVLAMVRAGRPALAATAPRRGLAVYLVLAGLLTGVVWLAPLVQALAAGTPPPLIDHYTTTFTFGLDLAVITPATFAAAALVRRGDTAGHVVAAALLGVVILLAPTITLATLAQLDAGIRFAPPEIAGPIGGFLVLGGAGAVFLVRILRAAPGDLPAATR